MRVHQLTFAALAVAAGLSLTACQNDDGGTGHSAPSSTSTASSSNGGSASGSSGQGSGSGGSTSGGQSTGTGTGTGTSAGTGSNSNGGGNGRLGKCRTDELEITATDSTVGGDSEGTVAVQLKNGGGHSCTLSGYAGADLKTNAGPLSAKRSGQQPTRTVLKNGQSVYFGITYPFNKSGGSGVRITGLVVTPPDETKSVTLAWPGAASLPVTDGSGSPVKVGPIGSAGQGN